MWIFAEVVSVSRRDLVPVAYFLVAYRRNLVSSFPISQISVISSIDEKKTN